MQAIDAGTEVQNVGRGGYGGLGGFGDPLTYLITLGAISGNGGLFGNNNNEGAAGVLAGQTQSKLDCLSQNQTAIQSQISDQSTFQRFAGVEASLQNLSTTQRDIQFALAESSRDLQDTVFRESSATQRQLSACCCELRTGQAEIKSEINAQSAMLLRAGDQNTQKVLDRLCDNTIENLRSVNDGLRGALTTAEIKAEVREVCGGGRRGGLQVQ